MRPSHGVVNSSRAIAKMPDVESRKVPDYVPKWTSARYCLAFLGFLGFVNVYALRVNLSVAIISMMNSTDDTMNTTKQCPSHFSNKSSSNHQGEFNWSSSQKALVLGSFFYGYICTQILGGFLAGRFGGKYLFGGGVLCTTIFTLLTPLAARTNFGLLIATRVMEGIGEGVTFPAMHAMWGVWAPPIERSKMVSFTYAGSQFGTIIAQPISGILCASNFLGGWPSVFYVFGTLGLIWCALWFIFAFNKPSEHPRISAVELAYIESVVPQERNGNIPWSQILTSGPVWGIAISHFANNWGFYTLLTCLPLYLKNVLGFDISQNGLISSLPYLAMWININLMGYVADTIRERGYLTTTQTRKVFNSLGLFGPAVFLVAASFVGCSRVLAVMFICLSTTFAACAFPGFNANHIDIASRYAGILMGISNTVATIPGFVTPIVVQALTGHHEDQLHWRPVFYIASAVYIVGGISYLILGTGKEQQWNQSYYSARVGSDKGDTKPLLEDDKYQSADGIYAASHGDKLSS